MNRSLVLAATLSLAFPFAGMAQSSMQTASLSAPMTPREVHSLMRSAHDSAQYKQIAGYFHQQEAKFRAEAAAEAVERDRRLRTTQPLSLSEVSAPIRYGPAPL